MAQRTIDYGDNDNPAGRGDNNPLARLIADIQANFTELYAGGGGGGGSGAVANANNGRDILLTPQALTGVYSGAEDSGIAFGFTSFPGQKFSDPVVAFGYNVDAQTAIKDRTGTEKFANAIVFESEYAVDSGEGGTCTAGTTTTQVTISGKTWAPGRFIGWTVFNVSAAIRGGSNALDTSGTYSAQITANAATTLTHAAIAGQTTGDVIQILRRDMEQYLQFAGNVDGSTYRAFRPFMYTVDKGSIENKYAALTLTAATNAASAVFTTSVAHKLKIGDYVRFETLAGGTWGTRLNNRSRRVTALPSTTQFTIGVDSTALGVYTASSGVAYYEPEITSVFLADRNNGFQILAPTFRGGTAPSGQSWSDNLMMRVYNGVVDLFAGNEDNVFLNLYSGSAGTSYINGTHRGLAAYQLIVTGVSALSTFYSFQVYDQNGANPVQGLAVFRNNGEAFGGVNIGSARNLRTAALVVDGNGLQSGRPLAQFITSGTVNAGSYTFSCLDNAASTYQWAVDGFHNWIVRATAGATTDTDGFFYVPACAGPPTGVPARGTAGIYAGSFPMRYDSTNNRIYVYNGAWRSVTLA